MRSISKNERLICLRKISRNENERWFFKASVWFFVGQAFVLEERATNLFAQDFAQAKRALILSGQRLVLVGHAFDLEERATNLLAQDFAQRKRALVLSGQRLVLVCHALVLEERALEARARFPFSLKNRQFAVI